MNDDKKTDSDEMSLGYATMLCGAIGDSIGAPIEHLSKMEITERYGNLWEADTLPGNGECTDDTEMMLFTYEGLINAIKEHGTPVGENDTEDYVNTISKYLQCWVMQRGHFSELKAPYSGPIKLRSASERGFGDCGQTTINELALRLSFTDKAINESRGNGAMARSAPIGIIAAKLDKLDQNRQLRWAYNLGHEAASLTHGSEEAQCSTGTFAALVCALHNGEKLIGAIHKVINICKLSEGTQSKLAECLMGSPSIDKYEGWVAFEALSMAITAVIRHNTLREILIKTSFHNGDSDSVAFLSGQLWGSLHIPTFREFNYQSLEHIDVIKHLAGNL